MVGQAMLPDRPRCSFSRPEQTKRQCLLVACNLNCHRGNASQATVWQISTSVDMIRIIWATSHGPNVKGGAKLTSVKGWIWHYVRWCHLLCNKHPMQLQYDIPRYRHRQDLGTCQQACEHRRFHDCTDFFCRSSNMSTITAARKLTSDHSRRHCSDCCDPL